MRKEDILVKAARFRGELGYNDSDPINVIDVLENKKITTFFSDFSSSFSGMSIKADTEMFVLINSRHPIGRQNFSIAHELFHLFIQEGPMDVKNKKIEDNANLFAKYFLIPRIALQYFIRNNDIKIIEESSIVKMEQHFQVSRQALLYSLLDYKLITREKVNELKDNVQDSARKYTSDLSLYNSGRNNKIIGDYLELANNLLNNNVISEPNYLSLIRKNNIEE